MIIDGEVNAPAEAGGEQIAVSPPNPIDVDNIDHDAENAEGEQGKQPKAPAEEPAKKLSTREALEKAAAKVEEDAKTAEKQPKDLKDTKVADPKDKASERDETGKFKGKEQPVDANADANAQGKQPEAKSSDKPELNEAPARFSADAKTAWATAPEPVRAEVHRAVRELETGIEEHRKRWEPIKPFDDLARQHGTNVHEALERYVAFDRDLGTDLFGGLDRLIRDKTEGKFGLRDVVAEIAGQKPEQAQSQSETVIHGLRQEIADLKKVVGSVTTHIQTQTSETVGNQVSDFAKNHSNFDALASRIAEHITAGLSLDEAYTKAEADARQLADSLGFIPKPADPTPTPPAPAAQTDKGTKSITGAPGAGSEPAAKKASSSVRDAVRRAMQAAG